MTIMTPTQSGISATLSDEDRLSRAKDVNERIKNSMIELYIYSSIMIDEKLYKELGHENARDYFQQLDISKSLAYRYALIGRELRKMPELTGGVQDAEVISDTEEKPESKKSVHHGGHFFAEIDAQKLETLVRYAKDQLPELVENGEVELEDGSMLTQDDVKRETRQALTKQLKELQQAKQEAAEAKQELRIKHLENDALLKETEELRRNQRNITHEKDIRRQLNQALDTFDKLHDMMIHVEISEDLPESLKMQYVRIIQSTSALGTQQMRAYEWLIEELQAKNLI